MLSRIVQVAVASVLLSLALSSESQAQWEKLNNGLTSVNVIALALSGPNLFVGTVGGGVFRSTDNGATWTSASTGMPQNTTVRCFAVSGTNLFAGTSEGVFLSTNDGSNWTAVESGLMNFGVSSLAVGGTNLFAGTGGGVFISTNNGTSWASVDSGLTSPNGYCLAVSGTNLFAGTEGGGVFLSTNNGTSWASVDSGLTSPWVNCLAVSGTNLFAGSSIGGGVFLSTNEGTSWTAVDSGLTTSNEGAYVSALTVSGSILLAGTWGGVFLSTNNGTAWTYTGLRHFYINAMAVSGPNLFVGTESSGAGVWRRSISDMLPIQLASFSVQKSGSNSMLLTWTTASEINNYGFNVQKSLDKQTWMNVGELVHGHGTTLEPQKYSVTLPIAGGSWWVRLMQIDLDGTNTATEAKSIQMNSPVQFALEQNFPNPFNPSTTIRYGLPARTHVTMTIYNTLGQQVVELVNGDIDAGNHDVRVDGSNLASGVYFYRLTAGEHVDSKKLILMK